MKAPFAKALAFFTIAAGLLFLVKAQPAPTQTATVFPPTNPPSWVMLMWDLPSNTPANAIAHYKVYWGVAPVTYTNSIVSSNLFIGITQFVRGATYYFATTTVGTNSLESTNTSNEISWTSPVPPPPPNNTRVLGSR
jgi:hypothetical protein